MAKINIKAEMTSGMIIGVVLLIAGFLVLTFCFNIDTLYFNQHLSSLFSVM